MGAYGGIEKVGQRILQSMDATIQKVEAAADSSKASNFKKISIEGKSGSIDFS